MNELEPGTGKELGDLGLTSRADGPKPCAESLLAEFALLWLGHSRRKGAWEQADWAFEELCNRVLLFLGPDDAP